MSEDDDGILEYVPWAGDDEENFSTAVLGVVVGWLVAGIVALTNWVNAFISALFSVFERGIITILSQVDSVASTLGAVPELILETMETTVLAMAELGIAAPFLVVIFWSLLFLGILLVTRTAVATLREVII